MKRGKSFRRIAFWLAVALSAWGWFGVSSQDETDARRFDRLAAEWQRNPEFRAINTSYCDDGSRALAATPFGVRANDVVMALRSIPGLPKDLAVNPTSELHYRRFAMGPLCAYLHLCTEQDIPTFARVLEEAVTKHPAATTPTTTATITQPTVIADPIVAARELLESFHMDEPVSADVGAVQSAAALIHDVDPRKPLVIRQNIDALLLPQIRDLARELGVPERVDDMTATQQRWVFARLDAHVRTHDPELWRTKQLSDFCCGIWAQVYGPSYGLAIKPILLVHRVAGGALLALVLWALWRRPGDRLHRGSLPDPSEPGIANSSPTAPTDAGESAL
jgi:hypothetical protein